MKGDKKIILGILEVITILILIVFLLAFPSSSETTSDTKHFENQYISFDYPAEWDICSYTGNGINMFVSMSDFTETNQTGEHLFGYVLVNKLSPGLTSVDGINRFKPNADHTIINQSYITVNGLNFYQSILYCNGTYEYNALIGQDNELNNSYLYTIDIYNENTGIPPGYELILQTFKIKTLK